MKKIIMIPNRQIRRELTKKIRWQVTVFDGSSGAVAVFSVFRKAHSLLRILKKKIRSFSSKMRLNGLKMSNFGGKWRFSAGAAVPSVLWEDLFISEN